MLPMKRREAQIVEQRVVIEVDEAGEAAALADGEAVVAAVAVEPLRHVVNHLREGERDHDEIDAARAQAERADDEREQRRDRDGGRPLHEARGNAFLPQNADRIAADAEIRGMAETHHAAVAHDQIEAHRGDRHDDDAGEQGQREWIAGHRRIERHQRQQRQHGCGQRGARIEPGRENRLWGDSRERFICSPPGTDLPAGRPGSAAISM